MRSNSSLSQTGSVKGMIGWRPAFATAHSLTSGVQYSFDARLVSSGTSPTGGSPETTTVSCTRSPAPSGSSVSSIRLCPSAGMKAAT